MGRATHLGETTALGVAPNGRHIPLNCDANGNLIVSLSGQPVNGAAVGIVGLVGGGATNLDGVPTVGMGSMLYYVNDATYGYGLWEKIPGTVASGVATNQFFPVDYNAGTNAFIWQRRF